MPAITIAILGAGAWGTAVAVLLAQKKNHRVRLWSARPENARELLATRENARLLPGVVIPGEVLLTVNVEEAVADADLLVTAIPTAPLRTTLTRIARYIPAAVPAISLTKGLEVATFVRPTQIIQDVLGTHATAVLSGPSHAEEVARSIPSSVVVASEDLNLARKIQDCFSSERFRVYTNLDVVGVELAGALKNVIAVAAGICDGLGLGDNSKAALLTRGLAEMARFGVALGAESQTFWGLAGMGDLITTSFSRHGRNRHVGERLGKGETPAQILNGMMTVAEGVNTARSVHDRAAQMGIAMPITDEVYRVLYDKKDPRSAVTDLMIREPKSERL